MATKTKPESKNGPVTVTKPGGKSETIPAWGSPEAKPYMQKKADQFAAKADPKTLTALRELLLLARTVSGYKVVCQRLLAKAKDEQDDDE